MASIKKVTADSGGVARLLRHNNRDSRYHSKSNPDIDPTLSDRNYSLSPDRPCTPQEYYKVRLDTVYLYKRKDVVTLAEVVCTLPRNIRLDDTEAQREFFQQTYNFLVQRYGGQYEENVVSCCVHLDEGKRRPVLNRFTGEPELNPDGTEKTELICGRPHLHFDFIPCVKIDMERELAKKHHDPKIEKYTEKVCCSKVLTAREYKVFHPQWERYLRTNATLDSVKNAEVRTGITKQQGGNISVEKYKSTYLEIEKEIEKLRAMQFKIVNDVDRTDEIRGRF